MKTHLKYTAPSIINFFILIIVLNFIWGYSTSLATTQTRGCTELLSTSFQPPTVANFGKNHFDFKDYCAFKNTWEQMKHNNDPIFQQMREFVKRTNYCFVTVKGFGNELYGIPEIPPLSIYMKESEDVIYELLSSHSQFNSLFAKPFVPKMSSSQNTKEAAESLLNQLIKHQTSPPWKGVLTMKNEKCEKYILHCHSKGGATCYNIGADDVLDKNPKYRAWVKEHIAMVVSDGGVISGGSPIADIALAYCEENDKCMNIIMNNPRAKSDYALIKDGRTERQEIMKKWAEFKKRKKLNLESFQQKLLLAIDEDFSLLAARLSKGGLMSLTSSYVKIRRDQVRQSNNPIKNRFYYTSSLKDYRDYDPTNALSVFSEFQASINKEGDGLVPCEYQLDAQIGKWLMDTKNMSHIESNTPSVISNAPYKCRMGYAYKLYINLMEEARNANTNNTSDFIDDGKASSSY